MNDGKYEEALQTLQTIIIHAKSVNTILALFDKVQCLIKVNQTVKGIAFVALRILPLIEALYSTNEFKDSLDEIYKKSDKLIETLIETKLSNCILPISQCQFDLSRNLLKGEKLLIKLKDIGYKFSKIAEKLNSQNKPKEIKEYYPLMIEILETMQMTTEVDLIEKSKLCASFLQKFGYCLGKTEDWINSIAVHEQAIGILKTAFDSQAYEDENLGHCYSNVGIAYKSLGKLEKAKSCFKEAILVYKRANFMDINHKQNCLQNTERLLKTCSQTT